MKNKKERLSLLAALIIAAFTSPVLAQEVTEHPLIRPFPGAVFDQQRSEQVNFGEFEFRTGTPPTTPMVKSLSTAYYSILTGLHCNRNQASKCRIYFHCWP
jgi:hypothetical protein